MTTPLADYQVFLPLIQVNRPPLRYGVQDETKGAYQPHYAPGSRVHIPFRWDIVDIDGFTPYYRLPSIAANHHLTIGVRACPERFRLWPEVACSPPAPEHYITFAAFCVQALEYTGAHAIALWNEPNMERGGIGGMPTAGCWGEDMLSGEMYGNFVRSVAGVIRRNCPSATIVAGEFMAAQDDFTPSAIDVADEHVDCWSFHHYRWYGHDWQPSLYIDWLRQWTDKPLWMTETALLWDKDCDCGEFRQAQAQHFHDAKALLGQVEYFYWYTIAGNGWACSDMGIDTPVYYEYARQLII